MATRVCNYCHNIFETKQRHSRVCPECKRKNHLKKIKKTIFNEEDLIV